MSAPSTKGAPSGSQLDQTAGYPDQVQLTASAPHGLTGQLRIWLNGRLYDDSHQAAVASTDHGLVVGDGVFETLKVTERGAFAVRRHLNRLNRQQRWAFQNLIMGRSAKPSMQFLMAVTSRGKLRITYTGGRGPLGSEAAHGPPTVIIMLAPVDASPQLTSIVTAPWTRNEHGALAGEIHLVRGKCSWSRVCG